jgi:hypothetical protein
VRRSRAVQRLDEATTSRCPGCGRDTKTVPGVCADCRHAKEADAVIPPARTERLGLFDVGLDWDDPLGIAVVALILTALAALLLEVVLW